MGTALFVLSMLISEGKKIECTPPALTYGVATLEDCHQDDSSEKFGCAYSTCLKDPVGQVWCGSILLIRETCVGAFKPVLMQLSPVTPPSEHDHEL